MKHILLCLIAFAFLACTDGKTTESSTTTVKSSGASDSVKDTTATRSPLKEESLQKKEPMRLETFTSIPDELIGCGCSFFLSKEDQDADKHIYRDAGHAAVVKLNRDLHWLDYQHVGEGKTLYKNDYMQIEVNITKTVESKDMEETADVEGTFTITKGEEKLVQKFVGYCGC